jgi:hypothetical protein
MARLPLFSEGGGAVLVISGAGASFESEAGVESPGLSPDSKASASSIATALGFPLGVQAAQPPMHRVRIEQAAKIRNG